MSREPTVEEMYAGYIRLYQRRAADHGQPGHTPPTLEEFCETWDRVCKDPEVTQAWIEDYVEEGGYDRVKREAQEFTQRFFEGK